MNDIYTNNYKKILIIPILALIPLLFFSMISPGLKLGIELTGGNVLIIRSENELLASDIEEILTSDFDLSNVKVSTINSPNSHGAYIEYSKSEKVLATEELISNAQLLIDEEKDAESIAASVLAIKTLTGKELSFDNPKTALIAAQDELGIENEAFAKSLQTVLSQKLDLGENAEFQRREVSPTLGKASLDSGIFIVLISFIFLVIVIFISFRQLIPTVGIVQAMIYDVIAACAGMALFNIPFSLLTLSTILMVIGYSVDTDIMLTSRMLKDKEGTAGERATESMKTGLTMTGTTMAALISMLIVSYIYHIDVIFQVAIILFSGLIGDTVSTWTTNVSILMWFVERKAKK